MCYPIHNIPILSAPCLQNINNFLDFIKRKTKEKGDIILFYILLP